MILLILTTLTTIAFLLAAFTPQIPAGRWIRARLVDAPAKVLNDGPLKATIGIVGFLCLMVLYLSAPELTLVMGLADASLVIDLVVMTFVLGTVERLKAAGPWAADTARRLAAPLTRSARSRSPRGARRPRRARPAKPADDGWPGAAWGLAAA